MEQTSASHHSKFIKSQRNNSSIHTPAKSADRILNCKLAGIQKPNDKSRSDISGVSDSKILSISALTKHHVPSSIFPTPHPSLQASVVNTDTLVTQSRAEMRQYMKEKNPRSVPLERKRSIKELVESFEDLSSPFMKSTTRPHSMEINYDVLSETARMEEEKGRDVGGAVGNARISVGGTSSAFRRPPIREVSGSDPNIFKR